MEGQYCCAEGGANLSLSGVLADNSQVYSSAKLFNKRDAISPTYLAVNPGVYLLFSIHRAIC